MTTSTDAVPILKRAIDLLDASLGDSDPMIGEDLTQDEIEDEYPVMAAMQILTTLFTSLRDAAPEVQADHIADERKMVAADLYLWLAGSNDNRFIRAWTDDPAKVDSLREAIGLEPARYYAAPASYVGDQEVGS